ncbi:MAG: hypothetical protein L6V85_07920 [Clostridiales bacterium]|nr:MAG: hypothetical protein L6V85_07920 [Clostridiales bacterium]
MNPSSRSIERARALSVVINLTMPKSSVSAIDSVKISIFSFARTPASSF